MPMTDRSSQALWEGHVLYPQGRRDMATAEGWTVGPGCPSVRAENAGSHQLHPQEPPSTGRLGAGPQDTMVTSELVQHETQQNATTPDQHVTTPRNPGWMADGISMNTRVRLSAVPWCRVERVQFSSVAQLCPTLRPHGLQRTRLPCPSPTHGACSNSCPLSR